MTVSCAVSRCDGEVVVEVRFARAVLADRGRATERVVVTGSPSAVWYGYCGWHGYFKGRLRWEPWQIAETRLTTRPESGTV